MGRLVGLQKQPILVGDSPSSLRYLTRQAEPRANRHSDHEQNSTQAIRYMERLLTADELAERLGMKTEWVWAQARAGRIPHVRLGRYRRFRESAVDAWLQDLETGGSGGLRLRNPTPSLYADARSPATRVAPKSKERSPRHFGIPAALSSPRKDPFRGSAHARAPTNWWTIGRHIGRGPAIGLARNWSLAGLSLRGERGDSNPRPPGPQPGALPAELRPPWRIGI